MKSYETNSRLQKKKSIVKSPVIMGTIAYNEVGLIWTDVTLSFHPPNCSLHFCNFRFGDSITSLRRFSQERKCSTSDREVLSKNLLTYLPTYSRTHPSPTSRCEEEDPYRLERVGVSVTESESVERLFTTMGLYEPCVSKVTP